MVCGYVSFLINGSCVPAWSNPQEPTGLSILASMSPPEGTEKSHHI